MRSQHTRLPDSAFEPLEITAYLECGVIADEMLPIDAVLYYHAMRERYGGQDITYPGQDHAERVAAVSLPIKRIDGHGPMWFYSASFARWSDPVTEGQDHWNKRLDMSLVSLIDFQGRRGNLDIASGRYKSYHMPVFYRHALTATWCVLGHRETIARWLPFLTHLGKKTAHGWGSVARWELRRAEYDWSVRDAGGRATRAIPATGGILTGFRPSYWLPKNQTACEIPVEAVKAAT